MYFSTLKFRGRKDNTVYKRTNPDCNGSKQISIMIGNGYLNSLRKLEGSSNAPTSYEGLFS